MTAHARVMRPRWFAQMSLSVLGWLGVMGIAVAQALSGSQPEVDPPGQVARLADFGGQVWVYGPDAGEWVAGVRNQPLTRGDHLATDVGSRAEVQVGSTVLRLDAATELEVLAVDDGQLSLALRGGSVATRVVDPNGTGRFTLDTDEGRFVLDRAGSFRFDRVDRAVFATVYSGQVRYEGPNSALPLVPGQRAQFWIDANGVAQYSLGAPVGDAFAAWIGEWDRRDVANVSLRYVSPEMTGAEDLDRYGRWEQNAEYGALWIPTAVAADWAPYSTGRWAFVRPWGWTWIDDARWGFAPFHYGRWVHVRNTWCWAPGTRTVRPVYAPALVAWIGGPRGGGPFAGGGRSPAVGWVPLAPREVYVPSYRASPVYLRNVNFSHVTNVSQINLVVNNPDGPRDFANRRFPHAVTVVPASVIGARQPVAPAAAQWRRDPESREWGAGAGRPSVLLAPPVGAPVGVGAGFGAVRPSDPRLLRPPPAAWAGRPSGEPPGFGPRPGGTAPWEREREARRGGDSPSSAQPGQPATRPFIPPQQPSPGQIPAQTLAQPQPALRPVAPPTVAAPAAVDTSPAPSMRPMPVRRGEERGGFPARPAETPAAADPRFGTPRIERPGDDRPAFNRPGDDRPAYSRPGFDRSGGERPGHEQPGFNRPGFERPGFDRPGFERSTVSPPPSRPAEAPRPVQALPQPALPQPAFQRPVEAARPPEFQRPAPMASPPAVEAARPAEAPRLAPIAPPAAATPMAPNVPRLEPRRFEPRDAR